jgi:mRNA-degrading endonuclease RelE of RelBE toxin-antitoxin system
MLGGLADNPRRVGEPLVGQLHGLWSARRGDYRIIDEIDDSTQVVLVHRVHHRRHVYRHR